MSTIHRSLTPNKVRVIDADKGTVDFIATSAAVDSYGEVVDPKGANLDRFAKNAPVMDSHDYSSIENMLGKVVDSRMEGGELIMRVQFAIDVPENTLAQKAFAMVKAGYLKACSIGFIPTQIARPSDGDWSETCEDLGLGDLENSIRCVYKSWQLLELSICAIGANPDCVAKSYAAGIIEKSDLFRVPEWRRALRSAQEPTQTTNTDMNQDFLARFTRAMTPSASAPTVKQAADNLERARRGQSESELFRASAMTRYAMARERRTVAHERAAEILSDGLIREYLEALPRYLSRVLVRDINLDIVRKSLIPSTALGGSLLPIDVSKAIFDLVLLNGAFRHMGVVEMTSMQTKIAQVTANPSAIWISPTYMGITTIPADASLTATSTTPEANTLAILLPVSRELLQDEKANLSLYLLTRFSEGLAAAFDYASCQGNGADDQTNGKQTGIWLDQTIATVSAAQGNASIPQLARADFLAAVAAVAPAALQRECKWLISPSFIAPLMTLVDTQGKEYLLKTPSETGDGTWRLVGFEVVWAAQAPAVQTAGSTIAAFGHLPSYQVAIREELEVMVGDSATGFQSNEKSFRALARGFCGTRAAAGLAKLALAAA